MIEVFDEEMRSAADPQMPVEKLATGFHFTEGPVWSRRGYVLFSDIPVFRIHKWENGKTAVYRDDLRNPNGLTFDHQGRLLVCRQGGVVRIEKDGQVTALASEGVVAPNDLVYSITGDIYFTDLRVPGQGKSLVYQITARGALRVAADDCQGPNGVALAPNQQRLFVADSRAKVIRVYDIAGDGALGNSRVWCEIPDGVDGLKTDEAGRVWAAGGERIHVFNAAGKRIGAIPVPERPSNCAWGDGFHSLYITARTSLYRIRTKSHGTRTY